MVNVASGNEMIAETDVAVPARGLNLTFSRVFNSMSAHDASNDDGTGADVFGNRWTNTFDARLAYDAASNTMIVYDGDGAKYVYTWNASTGSWDPPTGIYAQLVPKNSSCDYQWWKPDGTRFHFYAPAPVPGVNCGLSGGEYGLLWGITGRNHNNIIVLAYTFTGDASTREDITKIVAQHSDGETLTLTFAMFGSNDELQSIERPDNLTITYNYDAAGNLTEVDKPAAIQNQTRSFTTPDGQSYSSAILPETYRWYPLRSVMAAPSGKQMPTKKAALSVTGWDPEVIVCTPRAALAAKNGIGTTQTPGDGACTDLYTDLYSRATSVTDYASVNFTPNDGTNSVLQSGSTAWGVTQRVNFGYNYFNAAGDSTTTASDLHGHASQWDYDSLGRVLDKSVWPSSAANALVTSYTWNDNYNKIASYTDPRNNTTVYGYDVNGNPASRVAP